MKAKEKKKKISKIRDSSVDSTRDDSCDERHQLNGDPAKDLAIEKYMFTDEDDDNDNSGIMVKKEQQRKQRNESEKKRKDNIKLGIKKISTLLPESYKNPKDNYVNMLDKTVTYIEDLREQNEQLLLGNKETAQEQEIERLKKQVEILELQKRENDSVLQQLGPNISSDIIRGLSEWKGKESNTKKGLEKFLTTMMAENGSPDLALTGISPVIKKEKKKAKKSPTVSKHLSAIGVHESDVEGSVTSSCSLTGLLPEILPDGSMVPYSGNLAGFNINQAPNSIANTGIVPVMPPVAPAPIHLTPDGLTNGPGLYGAGPQVPVLTSSGKLVFLSPNSALQSGGNSASNVPSGGEAQTVSPEEDDDRSQISFPAPDSGISIKDESRIGTMNISDNPLLDPSMESLLGSPGLHPAAAPTKSPAASGSANISTPQIVSGANVPAMPTNHSTANMNLSGATNPVLMNASTPSGIPTVNLTSAPGSIPGLQGIPGMQGLTQPVQGASMPGLASGVQGTNFGLQGSVQGLPSGLQGMPVGSQGNNPVLQGTVPGLAAPNNGLQGTLIMHNGQLLLINKNTATPVTSAGAVAMNSNSDMTSSSATVSTPGFPAVSTSLSVGTTLTPSTGIKMATTANQTNTVQPNLAGLQTQSVMINGQQQTVQVVPSQGVPPPGAPAQSGVGQGIQTQGATAPQQLSNQTVTVNTPQGQVTMNTTPCQPNQLPSALILPNGQIVPVVTQPQTLFPQNQCVPINGGLLMASSQSQNVIGPANQPPMQSVAGKSGPIVMQPPILNQNVLGTAGVTNVRPPIAAQGTTVRLPNGQLAIVPSNTNLVRPMDANALKPGNMIRSSSSTIHHLPVGACSVPAPANNPLLNTQRMTGSVPTKALPGQHGQPVVQGGQLTTGLAGQIVMGPNGPYLQNVDNQDQSLLGQVPVATSGDTVPTSTTTDSKSTNVSSMTIASTSSSTMPALPQTVTAMLTADGNIILLPASNAGSTVTTATASQGKGGKNKNPRALKPKPSSGGRTSTTSTATTSSDHNTPMSSAAAADSTSQWLSDPQQGASPASCSVSSSTLGPLSISVSADNSAAQTSDGQDILAKAAESIFSSCGADISPSMGGFYNDDENPLQIDTSSAVTSQTEDHTRMEPPPVPSKTKPKRPPRKKAEGGSKSKKKAKPDSKAIELMDESPTEAEILDQLTDKNDDEDESDINDFADLIKIHQPSPPKSVDNMDMQWSNIEESVTPDTTQTELSAVMTPNSLPSMSQGSPAMLPAPSSQSQDMMSNLPTMPQLLPSLAKSLAQMPPKLPSPTKSISQSPYTLPHDNVPPTLQVSQPVQPQPQNIQSPVSVSDSTNQGCSIEQVMAAMQGTSPVPQPNASSSPAKETNDSAFSNLNFLCTVAEQHQQGKQKQPSPEPPELEAQPQPTQAPSCLISPATSTKTDHPILEPEQGAPEQAATQKKSKSSKKKKKDKKKNKEKHKKHEDGKVVDGSLPEMGVPGAAPVCDPGAPCGKPEKEKKKKKSKKKDKDKDKERKKEAQGTLMTTLTEDGSIGGLFNMDQPVPTPMFYNMPDTPAPPPPAIPAETLDHTTSFTTEDSAMETSMESSPRKEKSKSRKSRKKKGKEGEGSDGGLGCISDEITGSEDTRITQAMHSSGVQEPATVVISGISDLQTAEPVSPSKKKKNNRKRPIDDVIPEAITFSANELDDVLNQVESLGDSLPAEKQLTTPPVKIVLDGTEAPLPKRKKGDNEMMEHLIIRPSCKKKEERVSEDKLDEVFGKKTPDRPAILSPKAGSVTPACSEMMDTSKESVIPDTDLSTVSSPTKASPEKKEKKSKSKKSKKKNKEQAAVATEAQRSLLTGMDSHVMGPPMAPASTVMNNVMQSSEPQSRLSSMEVDLAKDLEIDRPVSSKPQAQASPPKLIDSITSVMNSAADEITDPIPKEPEMSTAAPKDFTFTSSESTMSQNIARQPQENSYHKKSMKDTSLFDLDSKEEPKMTPARHSNIYSLASHMAPPKYGPIVQPKTPKPSLPLHPPPVPSAVPTSTLTNLTVSEPEPVNDNMNSCSQPLDSPSPSTQMMDPPSQGRSKEHDLASSLPDELDIPDIVEERESEMNQEQGTNQESWKIRSPEYKKQDKPIALSPPKKVHSSQNQYSPRQHDNIRMDTGAEKENLSNAPTHMPKHPSSSSSTGRYSASSDGMFSPPGGNQAKSSNSSSIMKPCHDSPANAHNSGGMTPVTMESPRDTTTSRPMSSGPGEMYGPMPPMSAASSCALQGRQLEHFPFAPSAFPPISNPSSANRSSCSMSDNDAPFSINFTTSGNTGSSSSAYDSRHQFVYPPFLPMGPGPQKVRPTSSPLGHGVPPNVPSQMPLRMDIPTYSRNTSSSGNMEIATTKHSVHSGGMDRDKGLSHNMAPQNQQVARPISAGAMHNDNKSRDREQQRRSTPISVPPPQLSHPDKDMSHKAHEQSLPNNHQPTSAHSQNPSSSKHRSSSIGRSPQDSSQYMGPSSGNFSNQSPSLTSPPLHHPRPPSEPGRPGQQGAHRGSYEPLMFPANGHHSQFSPSFGPMYDAPPLHFTSKESGLSGQTNSSYSQSRSSSSSNMPHKQSSQSHNQGPAQRPSQGHGHHGSKMPSQKQASSHQSPQQSHPTPPAHHTSQQPAHHANQQQTPNPAPPAQPTKSRSKSSKKSATSGSSGSTKQLQHYEADASSTMFDPSRSMTPYFPISNLSPQPRNLPTDAPTYLTGNFFSNAGRPLSNTNSLQHNSFFPPSRAAQNGIFQAPPFPMNHMHPAASTNRSSPTQISQHSSSVSMGGHMPNFNLNLFDPAQADISPMKFPPGNSIMPQGASMDHNALQHHHQATGSLYHNRSQVPPMLHNLNSFLGHQHGFDARGMGPAMNSSMGPPFGAPGHTPFAGMPHLNFPMHDH